MWWYQSTLSCVAPLTPCGVCVCSRGRPVLAHSVLHMTSKLGLLNPGDSAIFHYFVSTNNSEHGVEAAAQACRTLRLVSPFGVVGGRVVAAAVHCVRWHNALVRCCKVRSIHRCGCAACVVFCDAGPTLVFVAEVLEPVHHIFFYVTPSTPNAQAVMVARVDGGSASVVSIPGVGLGAMYDVNASLALALPGLTVAGGRNALVTVRSLRRHLTVSWCLGASTPALLRHVPPSCPCHHSAVPCRAMPHRVHVAHCRLCISCVHPA